MNPSGEQFRILTGEAIRDAIRGRVTTAIVLFTLISLWFMDTCTSCAPGDLELQGQSIEEVGLIAVAAMVIFGVVAVWTQVLGGLLAADRLASPLDDGSAVLLLSRPVGRTAFALSRLAGSLAVSLGTSVVLLAAASLFVFYRHGVGLGPALAASFAAFAGQIVVAAMAMTASLYLNRVATFLLVLFSVGVVVLANMLMLTGAGVEGLLGVVNYYGPPLATSIAVTLAPWHGTPVELTTQVPVHLRLVLWMALAVAALVASFRRMEIQA